MSLKNLLVQKYFIKLVNLIAADTNLIPRKCEDILSKSMIVQQAQDNYSYGEVS